MSVCSLSICAFVFLLVVCATGSKTARVGAHIRAVRHAWGGGGLGWGGDDDVPCTCTHGRCYASHGVGWGGVGMMTFLALAHMCDATQLIGWGGGGDDVPCTCIHV